MGLSEQLFYLDLAPPFWPAWAGGTAVRAQPFAVGDGLLAQWSRRWPEHGAFAAGVDSLLRSVPSSTAFHAPPWQEAISRAFVRAGRYRLLSIQDDAGVAGLMPLWICGRGRLESVGAMVSDYLEPAIRPGREPAIWRAFLQAMRDVPGVAAREVLLRNLRRECVDLGALASAAAREGFTAEWEPACVVASTPLPATWEAYLARLSSHDRREIRRKVRNAQSKADARLLVVESPEGTAQALRSALDMMRGAGGIKGLKVLWIYRRLFARAGAGLAASRWLRVYQLHLKGKIAAGVIAFRSQAGPMLWGSGFDAETRAWSPGIVLFAMALQHAIAERATSFDFMRGESRYKSEFGAVESPIFNLRLTRNGS